MWRTVRRYYAFLLPVRLMFVALVVLIFGFCVADQGQDILRAMTEDWSGWPSTRLFMFFAASMMLALITWYWSRHLLRFRPGARRKDDQCRDPDDEPLVEDHPRATRWMPRIFGALVFGIELAGFAIVAGQYAKSPPRTAALQEHLGSQSPSLKLWWIVGLLVLEAVVYWLFVVYRRRLLRYSDDDMLRTIRSWSDFDGTTRRLLGATILVEAVMFLWACIDPVSWWILGVAAVLVLTIGLWIPIGSAVIALGETWRIPMLGFMLVVAVAISPLTDNHVIRVVDGPHERLTLQQAFDEWFARVQAMPARTSDGRVPAIVVAAEGGGIRAAYWTATVLAALQDKMPTFADHCFAISGVSGGALGAVVFDALLARRLTSGPSGRSMQGDVQEVLRFDALSGTLAGMSQPDFLQRFVPWPLLPDRARALELGWERGWMRAFPSEEHSLLSQGFVATLGRRPELPRLFLNGTVVEDGARIIASQVRFRSELEFRTAYDAFDELQRDIPMSTAAGMSTRFTYVSPAGKIPRPDRHSSFGHVIDGGYFENSGAVTAGEIVSFLEHDKRVRPFVVLADFRKPDADGPVRDDQDTSPFCPAPGRCGPQQPGKSERVANEILSPIRGLLATREARGSLALGDLLHHMRHEADDGSEDDLVDFRAIPRDVPLPLGWVLSDSAMDWLWRAVDCEGGNRAATAAVAGWLAAVPPSSRCGERVFPAVEKPRVRCDDAGCPNPVQSH